MGRNVRWALCGGFVALWTILLVMPTGPLLANLAKQEFILERKYFLVKTLHVSAYAVMTILCGWLRVPARFRWLLVFFLMGHATLTELIQENIQGRTGELHDVGFDHLGIALGIVFSWKWWVQKDEAANV